MVAEDPHGLPDFGPYSSSTAYILYFVAASTINKNILNLETIKKSLKIIKVVADGHD
jgi:hypothetical protein